jgi:hypothetical protein
LKRPIFPISFAIEGTLRHDELLALFGLDAAELDFRSKGLRLIARLIDEIEWRN